MRVNGKDKWVATGQEDWEMALETAKMLRRDILDGKIEELRKIGAVRTPRVATLGEVIERYLALAEKDESRRTLKVKTLTRNVNEMRRVVAISRGIPIPRVKGDGKPIGSRAQVKAAIKEQRDAFRKKIDETEMSFFTLKTAAAFFDNGLALKPKPLKPQGLNSTMSQACSLFAEDRLPLYEDLSLPDLEPFMTAQRCTTRTADTAFRVIPKKVLAAIEEAFKARRDAGEVDLWRAYLLVRRLGMRNVEAVAARENWFCEHNDAPAIGIIDRESENFKTKAGVQRFLELSPELIREFASIPAGKPLILPGDEFTFTERHELVNRGVNKVLRNFLKVEDGRLKCLYELRKQAGAEIVSDPKKGMPEAHYFLGHSSWKTTSETYSGLTHSPKALVHP